MVDPLEALDPEVDTSIGLMIAARRRGHTVWVAQPEDLSLRDGRCWARALSLGEARRASVGSARPVESSDVVLLRIDPPVERRYLDTCFLLDHVDPARTLLVNDPRGVRVANEKLWALQYADLVPPTVVTAAADEVNAFLALHGEAVVKPVDGHAGRGVLRLSARDPNRAALLELVTERGSRHVVVQAWLPGVAAGNRRVVVADGEPVGTLLRYPRETTSASARQRASWR